MSHELSVFVDMVYVCCNNAQNIVRHALDQSIRFILSKGTFERRKTSVIGYRLRQVADNLFNLAIYSVRNQLGMARS